MDPDLLDQLLLIAHLQYIVGLADAEPEAGEIQGTLVVTRRNQAADLALRVIEGAVAGGFSLGREEGRLRFPGKRLDPHCPPGLVRQADGDERAAWTLRTVDQRRRDPAGCGDPSRALERAGGLGDDLIVDRNAHTLLRLVVIGDRRRDSEAVLAEHQGLRAQLHAIGGPCLGTVVRVSRRPLLVIHRSRSSAFALDEIESGDQAVRVARQRDRSGVYPLGLLGRQQFVLFRVMASVPVGALERVGIVGEESVDPLVEEQARTVDELVEHPRRQVVGQTGRTGQVGARHAKTDPGQRRRRSGFDHGRLDLRDSSELSAPIRPTFRSLRSPSGHPRRCRDCRRGSRACRLR